MNLALWILDHPFIAAGVLCLVAVVMTALLCALVHYVLDPAAQWLARLVRDVREPSGRHRRICDLPAPRALEVPPRPDAAPLVWIDPDATAELSIPHDLVEETAA